ncbi:MAG: GHKL domain-containing protein [Lachnospiraceae bacterium]|nr:GHKL domain-containing protein [Lachnospiraceae bacterium]
MKTIAFDEDLRLQVQYRYILKVLFLAVLTSAIMNLMTERYTFGIILVLLSIFYFSFYWVVYRMKKTGVILVTILMNIITIILCGMLLLHGTTSGFSPVWMLILPQVTYLLTGIKAGTATSCTVLGMTMFLFWTPLGRSLLMHEYDAIFLERYPLVFMTMMVVSFYIETQRSIGLNEIKKNRQQMESMYQNQYDSMRTRIAEAKKVRHDMRHHFLALDQYLNDNKVEEAKAYISQYYDAIPFEESLTYCDHYVTNALLTYYYQRAKQEAITLNIKVQLPQQLPFKDEDLTVVFGNLIENAVQATISSMRESEKFIPGIWIRANYDGSELMLTIENTTLHEAKKGEGDRYLSSKHAGYGIGISSVRNIVDKYGGNFQIEQKDGRFKARIFISEQ